MWESRVLSGWPALHGQTIKVWAIRSQQKTQGKKQFLLFTSQSHNNAQGCDHLLTRRENVFLPLLLLLFLSCLTRFCTLCSQWMSYFRVMHIHSCSLSYWMQCVFSFLTQFSYEPGDTETVQMGYRSADSCWLNVSWIKCWHVNAGGAVQIVGFGRIYFGNFKEEHFQLQNKSCNRPSVLTPSWGKAHYGQLCLLCSTLLFSEWISCFLAKSHNGIGRHVTSCMGLLSPLAHENTNNTL